MNKVENSLGEGLVESAQLNSPNQVTEERTIHYPPAQPILRAACEQIRDAPMVQTPAPSSLDQGKMNDPGSFLTARAIKQIAADTIGLKRFSRISLGREPLKRGASGIQEASW